ncbi:MAG: zf-HC2 domain-containing protein [Fibrella sp.]|nr:zf-HC2 domain-containing protein [Armatimonadota bacterium]
MFSRTLFSRLPKPISCRIIAPLLIQYVEAEAAMTADERVAVNAHLSACPACHEEAATVRAMGAFLRERGPAALPAHVPAPDLWERIEGRIVTEQRESRRSFSLRPVLLFAPALAAIIVAVILMPKQDQRSDAPSMVAAMKNDGVAPFAKKSGALVEMDEARTTRLSFAASPAATPAASRTQAAEMKSVPRRMTVVADAKSRDRTSEINRRTESADFSRSKNVVLTPRDTHNARLIAQSVPQPKLSFDVITIVDVDTKPAPTVVAMARIPTEPRPVAPPSTDSERSFGFTGELKRTTITVVQSDPGSGVTGTAAAYTPPSVTDTMIRQRQRRGLFGGYGAGAAIAVLPTTGGAGTGSETATPW